MNTHFRRWSATLLVLAAATQAVATPLQGQFTNDDDLFLTSFTLTGAARVQVSTSSWADGGFAPVLALFGGAGLLQLDAGSSHACGPGSGAPDPASGFCWDALLDTTLGAGLYTLVLSQDGNMPLGSRPSDGYSQDGQPDYTGLSYLGQPGATFINVDARQRSGEWALDLRIDPLQVPEPAVASLLALAWLAGSLRRRGGA